MNLINDLPCIGVSELSLHIRLLLEEGLSFVRVRGELSGVKLHGSGHLYFALKDTDSVVDGVMWRGQAENLGFQPQDGMEVVCAGKVTTYAGRSKYQIIASQIELAGEGALLKIIEERKRKLASEGLFDQSRKKPLPDFPSRIAVITSATGAVIHDILHRIQERYPLHVMLWPVSVQGNAAASEIVHALQNISALQKESRLYPDVIILARGGGSIEDLMPFQEESVVRAVAECPIPIVTAIGHETDTTLVDFASDKRAPTPTAAAEMITPVRTECLEMLDMTKIRLNRLLFEKVQYFSQKLEGASARLGRAQTRFMLMEQRLDEVYFRMTSLIKHNLQLISQKLKNTDSLLESYSYKNVLKRGYAIVTTMEGSVIPLRSQMVPTDNSVRVHFSDGDSVFYKQSSAKIKASKSIKSSHNQQKLFG